MSSVSLSQSSAVPGRPQIIAWATWITIATTITGFALFALPGAEDIPAGAIVVAVVAGAITLAGCWWLWNCKRWAAILLTVVGVLNCGRARRPIRP